MRILFIALGCWSLSVAAEIVTDGSMGAGLIELDGSTYRIPEAVGQRVGANVFHSFRQFDVAAGETAWFSTQGDTRAIISRVTGGVPSRIDGTIRSLAPGADWVLLNPAGVWLGGQARVEVSGGFYLATADYLELADGGRFFAAADHASRFSSAPPKAFGFLGTPRGEIALSDRARITASAVEITTDRLRLSGFATLNVNRDNPGARVAMQARAITLVDRATIFANAGTGGGAIVVTSDHFEMRDRTMLNVATFGANSAGAVDIRANTVDLAGDATINASAAANSTGAGGRIAVFADRFSMADEAWLFSGSLGAGDSGSIDVRAGRMTLADNSVIATTTFAQGKAGRLLLTVSDGLALKDQAVISGGTEGQGAGGDVVVLLTGYSADWIDARRISVASDSGLAFQQRVRAGIAFSEQIGVPIQPALFATGGVPGRAWVKRLAAGKPRWDDALMDAEILVACGGGSGKTNRLSILGRKGLVEALYGFSSAPSRAEESFAGTGSRLPPFSREPLNKTWVPEKSPPE